MEADLTKFNLTRKQIRLIKLSLTIQKLAEKPYNKLSQKFIDDWYCHAAIAAIILEDFDSILLNKENLLTTPENFLSWSRGDQQVTDAHQIVFSLATVPTPAVIHLTNIKRGKEIAFHTIYIWVFKIINSSSLRRLQQENHFNYQLSITYSRTTRDTTGDLVVQSFSLRTDRRIHVHLFQ